MDTNKVTLIGNLINNPTGKLGLDKLTSFKLVTQYDYSKDGKKKKPSTIERHDIVAHGKLAEIIMTYLKKDSRVYLEGVIKNKKIVVSEVIMLGQRNK